MFSFHKPKIYRSNLGCCICKAKSSSSRFTDSKKYENEFERCFRIQEKRSGEICNACVLLVKRWKKLSPDNRLIKHWHHVVDARAGPGTKITGNRRITSTSSSHHNQSSSETLTSNSRAQKATGNKAEVLPLSSSQSNSQASSSSSTGRGRASSLSKARAIDTNVSTFTFGEPPTSYRRSYMNNESHSNYMSYSSTGSPFAKPQSALNSSAFESVIKRFRQRQQQQEIETQRRQLNRLERQKLRQANKTATSPAKAIASSDGNGEISTLLNSPSHSTSACEENESSKGSSFTSLTPPTKRVKRTSENYGSHASLESLKISSVLDSSIWRREKICCGVIFRGLFNEVAVFPKLLKPCDYRLMKSGKKDSQGCQSQATGELANDDAKDPIKKADEPLPRATKSGSISSCNSSTSGTGSMEPTLDEIKRTNRSQNDPSPAVRPRSVPTKKRRQPLQSQLRQQHRHQNDDAESNSTSSASTLSSSGKVDSPNGSDESTSRMMIFVDGCQLMEDEDDDAADELVMAEEEEEEEDDEEEECESSNDASSSAESLVELEAKASSAVV